MPSGPRDASSLPVPLAGAAPDEVRTLIEDRPTRRRDVLDLARGALDAGRHPPVPSQESRRRPRSRPAGSTWTLWSLLILTAPAPPDWPGYVEEMLISALAVAGPGDCRDRCLAPLGDDATRFERMIDQRSRWQATQRGSSCSLRPPLGIAYGAPTAIASTAAAVGTMFVGFALMTVNDMRVGALVAIAAVGLLVRTRSAGSCSDSGGSRRVSRCSDPGQEVAAGPSRFVLTPATGGYIVNRYSDMEVAMAPRSPSSVVLPSRRC